MEAIKKKIFLSSKKLFETYSPKKVSIDMITKEAGIGKGTFYNYFKNKEDVYEQIIDEYMNGGHSEEKMQAILSLEKEKKLLHLFILMGITALRDPIVKNFVLKNENFFIGKIDYEYLEFHHHQKLQELFAGNFKNFDPGFLSDILWMYIQELVNKENELSETEMKHYSAKLAGVFVGGYISDYEVLVEEICFEEIESCYKCINF